MSQKRIQVETDNPRIIDAFRTIMYGDNSGRLYGSYNSIPISLVIDGVAMIPTKLDIEEIERSSNRRKITLVLET